MKLKYEKDIKSRNSCPVRYGIIYRKPDICSFKITAARWKHPTDRQTDRKIDRQTEVLVYVIQISSFGQVDTKEVALGQRLRLF